MFSTSEILIGVCVISIGYYYFKKLSKPRNAIPEPFTLPIVGHMFFLGSQFYLQIAKWAKIYGNVYKLKLGQIETVILSDPAASREAFNMQVFNGRSDMESFQLTADGKNGIIASDGQVWTEQRRFAVRHLRDFGFGKKSIENMIMEDVNEFVEGIRKEKGKPVLVQRKFSLVVLNSLWQMVTGSRYKHDDPKLNQLQQRANEEFGELVLNPLIAFFPSFAKRFPKLTGWKSFKDTCKSLRDFFGEQVAEHRKTYEENNPRDLIDCYLQEINKTTDPASSFYKESGENQLIAVIGDMFNAGSDTTSSTLQWAILFLSQNPSVQSKFRSEVQEVVGKSRHPSLEDKPRLPYTECVIMEVLRKSSIVPTGVMHCVMADVEFHGYQFRKGCGISSNFYAIHHDPKTWGDPENFRPERFMDNNGQCIKKHDCLMPFSVGKRACVGESLARDTLYLFLTSIVQQFEILPEPGVKVSLEGKPGLILAPHPFKVIFNPV